MPGVLTNRTRVTTTVRLGEAQLDAGADHERRSVVEPSPFWSSVPYDINVLPLEATIKQRVSSSLSLNRSLELEITFCVRGGGNAKKLKLTPLGCRLGSNAKASLAGSECGSRGRVATLRPANSLFDTVSRLHRLANNPLRR